MRLTITELTPRKNWPSGRMPDWVDERTRLYSGFKINAAGRQWTEILAHHDGERTTAYLTADGFRVDGHGPAIHQVDGGTAKYRKVVSEWFRDFADAEVSFAGGR